MLNVKMAFQSIKKDQILTDLNTFSAFFLFHPKSSFLHHYHHLKKENIKIKKLNNHNQLQKCLLFKKY